MSICTSDLRPTCTRLLASPWKPPRTPRMPPPNPLLSGDAQFADRPTGGSTGCPWGGPGS
eukprot:7345844-Alexandrium_andersonii.AAC.1